MKSSSDELVTRIIARLSQRRVENPLAALDDVLNEFPEITDREATLRASLQRMSMTMSRGGSAAMASEEAAVLPELEGYHIIDCIGRGGMGSVYEAYQQSTGRRVAVKFMHAPLEASERSRRRFEREVELVARLEHPNIVSIVDSGVLAGQYFFVMEYVEGRTLDEAMRGGEASINECLGIVCEIAKTVDYAHQRGVLHRDLKPSNIVLDDQKQVHLLDFGLAKALDSGGETDVDASLSRPGDLVGTLGYMPPEQARGLTQFVSVRSDVYSLGAITYELVTGKLPVSVVGELTDILIGIRDREPARPSSVRPACDADIDAILLKALAKEPERRYATAAEFAADIERYLEGRPILARRISGAARAWRWVRRHRAISSITAAALATILTVTSVSFVRISMARDRAEQLNETLAAMLLMVDPDSAGGQEMSVPRFLDEAARWLDSDAGAPPDVEAMVRETLGRMYLKLGPSAAQRAEAQFTEELRLWREHGGSDAQIASATMWIAAAWWNQRRFQEAEAQYLRARDMRMKLFPVESLEVAEVQHHLAACLDNMGRHDEAADLFKSVLATRVRLLGEAHEETAASHIFYGLCLDKLGQTGEAIAQTRAAVKAVETIYGPDHWRVVRGVRQLARLLQKHGDLEAALIEWQRAAEGLSKLLGPDHQDVLEAERELAALRARVKSENSPSLSGEPPSAGEGKAKSDKND